MVEWYWVLIGVFGGVAFGMWIISLCVASGDAEKNQPRPSRKGGKNGT